MKLPDISGLQQLITAKVLAAEQHFAGAALGPDKLQWVIEQVDACVLAVVDKALPEFRPILDPMIRMLVPFLINQAVHALFHTPAVASA